MAARYQMTLEPCEATSKSYWGRVIAEGESLLALWERVGWRGETAWEQVVSVMDSKTGKRLTIEEYGEIVKRLKGWE